MKRTAIALVLASLIAATHAVAAESAFPQGATEEPIGLGLPAQSTYADAHAGDPVRTVGSPFAQGADGEPTGNPAQSTYADAHIGDPVRTAGSPFPEGADGEPTGLPSLSTYAERFDPERSVAGE